MYNATRRNRNIGTKKAGWKKQTYFGRPYESLNYTKAEKITATVHDTEINFYVDKLKEGYVHSCTVQDVVNVLSKLPKNDVLGIEHVYFRQPTKRQCIFTPAWGRIYYFSGPDFAPILLIESVPCPFYMKMDHHLDRFWQTELDFLKKNCESYKLTKRHHLLTFQREHLRAIQLFRTVPHEIGHWVDFKSGMEDLPSIQKEERANRYAKRYFGEDQSPRQNLDPASCS